jgi:hypothetical protein
MGPMTRVALVGVAAAAAAVAGVLELGRSGSPPAIAPAESVSVRAVFEPAVVDFGDPVTAHVVVLLDRRAVQPSTLRITDDIAPLTTLSAPKTVPTISGRLETVSITERVACLTDPCVARTVDFPRVRVSVSRRDRSVATAAASWRPLQVNSRVGAADLTASAPPFAADTTLGSPGYRLSPSTAATVLDVVSAVAAAGAIALIALQLVALTRTRRRTDTGDELERALRLVREAEQRPVPDRRRALGRLARLLRAIDGGLGRAASDLAWSEPGPERQAVDEFVTRVERDRVS